MKDQFGNEARLLDAVVFSSCNTVRFGIVSGIRIEQENEGGLKTVYSFLYWNTYWNGETGLSKFWPRKGFVKIPREALPVAFNELLVKNGY